MIATACQFGAALPGKPNLVSNYVENFPVKGRGSLVGRATVLLASLSLTFPC